jgi:hypothetical protein
MGTMRTGVVRLETVADGRPVQIDGLAFSRW